MGSSCYNWAIFQKSQRPDLAEDLIRWIEDEKRFAEYVEVSVGQGLLIVGKGQVHPQPVLEVRHPQVPRRWSATTSCAA